jgi:uncharacterized repeat protein (TIGR03847 family)
MSPESLDLGDLDKFAVGTRGPIGRRVFLLQLRCGGLEVTLKAEKQQVAVLAEYLGRLLTEIGSSADQGEPIDLDEPAEPRFVIGALGVGYDDARDRIVLLAEELVPEGEDGDSTRFAVTREQASAFAKAAASLVAAGRPACPMCGLPLDPEGHECPRTNGHRAPKA